MKQLLAYSLFILLVSCMISCEKNPAPAEEYKFVPSGQENAAQVLWNPEDYDFEQGNSYFLEHYTELISGDGSAGACSSWRNGHFHGRNLDWFQANYGCLIIRMPKGGKVKHSSVAVLNGLSTITQKFIKEGKIDDLYKRILPCAVMDGINDAGVAVNINIVPHLEDMAFPEVKGDLSCVCVVRYVLDNAGSVDEAISLLKSRKVSHDLIDLAGDETHYMISDNIETAVVEFENGETVVTRFKNNGKGYYSEKNNPAIMTNFYTFASERWEAGSEEFYNNHPLAMGVERWDIIKEQYDKAKESVKNNLEIAKSVWLCKNFVLDKCLWYTENAIPSQYGKDERGWYYFQGDEKINCSNYSEAQEGFWKVYMNEYWAYYDKEYASLPDPHVKGNEFWETSHTVIYDLDAIKGYLVPFENFYAKDKASLEPIEIILP